MTMAVRDRILKDVNGNISDHVRNHIHLTNCIHLKNHMHKNSPILVDRLLLRDLVVLQRSRSLKDPSASPPSSAVDALLRRGEGEDVVGGRRSVGIEHGTVSGNSPAMAAVSSCGSKERRVIGNDECEGDGEDLVGDRVLGGSSQLRGNSMDMRGGYRQDRQLRTLSDQLRNVQIGSDDVVLSCNRGDVRRVFHSEKYPEEAGVSIRHRSSLNRRRRRMFRGGKRSRPSVAVRDGGDARNERRWRLIRFVRVKLLRNITGRKKSSNSTFKMSTVIRETNVVYRGTGRGFITEGSRFLTWPAGASLVVCLNQGRRNVVPILEGWISLTCQ